MLVSFSKKFPFGGKCNLGPVWAKIMQPCLMIFSLIIFFEILYDRAICSVIVPDNFPKKHILGKMGNLGPI